MRHSLIIRTLGGRKKVAPGMGANYQTVRGWEENDNIPPKHWAPLIAFAKTLNIDLSPADLAAGVEQALQEKRAREGAAAANDSEGERAGAA